MELTQWAMVDREISPCDVEKIMPAIQKIIPCLWFDDQAEEAVTFYTGIFPRSKIERIARYSDAGGDVHRQVPGSVMIIAFELDGQAFTALNGGPRFTFSEAISFQVSCDTQKEIDYYWSKLGEGGDVRAQQCGWLKDRYGASWQIVPAILSEIFSDGEAEGAKRAMRAMLHMKKLDIALLRQACTG